MWKGEYTRHIYEAIFLGCLYKTLVVSMSDSGCAAIEETRDIDQAPNLLSDDIA